MRFSGFEHMLSYWAREAPDSPALLYEEGGEARAVSFKGLYDAVSRRALELRAGGKTCLGVLCDGSLACVTEIFAANKAGLQIVLLDENAPLSALGALMKYTDVDSLWGDAELCGELAPYLTGGAAGGEGQILFFTSGTTERAKAVVLTDASLCQSAYNGGAMLPLSREDVLLCMLPLGHVFGFVCGLLWGLSCGAAVALGRGARHYMDDCAFYKPTAVSVVPTLLGFLLTRAPINPELKLVLVGAGDCPAALLGAAKAKGLRVCFGYGLTETSSGVAISVEGDPYAMAVCPDDEITLAPDGEILISAPTCVMRGYYKRPEDTAAALAGGVLHSGDLGYFDADGKLHISGRKKDVLVLPDGTKLFLPEYEGEIARALGHTELAVILIDSRPALVYCGEGDARELMEKLRGVMAGRPRGQQLARIIVTDEPLPRTATGKIKRWELQQKVSGK